MPGYTLKLIPDEDAAPQGLRPGEEVRREGEAGIADAVTNSTEIVPADLTTATWVTVKFGNTTGAPQDVAIESWAGSGQDTQTVPDGSEVALNLLLGIGESYYVSQLRGCTLERIVERSL